jgi:hypothetical protein
MCGTAISRGLSDSLWLTALLADLQIRAEVFGAVLAAICIATPALQQRLLALTSGKASAPAGVAAVQPAFRLCPHLSEADRQVLLATQLYMRTMAAASFRSYTMWMLCAVTSSTFEVACAGIGLGNICAVAEHEC